MCAAQSEFAHKYTTRNGLPSNNTFLVSQDDNGYVWVPTSNGIAKFNGQRFKHFSKKDGLPSNEIFHSVSFNNQTWLYNYGPFITYITRDSIFSKRVTSYFHNQEIFTTQNFYEKNGVVTTIDKANSTLLLSSKDSFFTYDNRILLNYITALKDIIPDKLCTYRFFLLHTSSSINNEILMLAYDSTFITYDYYTDKAKKINIDRVIDLNWRNKLLKPTLFSNYITYTDESATNLHFLNYKTNENIDLEIPNASKGNKIIYFYADKDSSLIINTSQNIFIRVNNDIKPIDTFSWNLNEQISSFHKDKSGNNWISTVSEGLYFISKFYLPFKKISLEFETEKILNLYSHDKHYFIFDINSNLYITDKKFHLQKKIHLPLVDKSYPNISKYWFHPENDGGYYIASAFGKYYLDSNFNAITKLQLPTFVSCKDFTYINSRSEYIIASGSGIYKIRKNKSSFSVQSRKKIFNGDRIMNISEYNDQYLLGTNDAGDIVFYDTSLHIHDSIHINNNIVFSTVDNGNIIVAVESEGVYYYDKTLKSVNLILANENLTYFKNSDNGFWVGNEAYIAKLVWDGNKYTVDKKYLNLNGLLYKEIYSISENDGPDFLLCDKGIIQLPDSFFSYQDKYFNESIHIASLKVRTTDSFFFNRTDSVFKYKYTPENLTFTFSCNSTAFLGNVHYKYYIEGSSSRWLTSNDGIINYPSLKPGSYTIHLKAVVNNLDLSTNEKVFVITVTPMWWQSLPFKFFIGLIILGAILFIVQLRIAAIKKKQDEQSDIDKKISALELNALQSQMNPHFIFNSLSSIQSFINTNKKDDANELLQKFSLLVRLYLEFSRKQTISIQQEVDSLKLYTEIEQLRFNNKFSVNIYIRANNIDPNDTFIPPMLVQPLVENAINHGLYHRMDNKGALKVFFLLKENQVTVIIDDNGIGRIEAKKLRNKLFPSIGNKLIADRIDILNKSGRANVTFKVIDKLNKDNSSNGTRVILTLNNNNYD
ncbi:MAG: histidine kinase [Flavipsychrobacter sp.]